MNLVYLALAITLVTITLVVRDQTEFRLSRLRAELASLRSEEKRLQEERQDLDRIIAQVGEALTRAGMRQASADESCRLITEGLVALGVTVELPALPSLPGLQPTAEDATPAPVPDPAKAVPTQDT